MFNICHRDRCQAGGGGRRKILPLPFVSFLDPWASFLLSCGGSPCLAALPSIILITILEPACCGGNMWAQRKLLIKYVSVTHVSLIMSVTGYHHIFFSIPLCRQQDYFENWKLSKSVVLEAWLDQQENEGQTCIWSSWDWASCVLLWGCTSWKHWVFVLYVIVHSWTEVHLWEQSWTRRQGCLIYVWSL